MMLNVVLYYVLGETNLDAGVGSMAGRQQYVRIRKNHFDILNCDICAPQCCVFSPILFSIYTSLIQSKHEDVKILKYAYDMAIVGLRPFILML